MGFFPDQDTNRSCGAYPTDDIAPDPTLAGSRRPTSIDAHANPSLVSSPAFKSPASPDFHDIQDRQKQPLYVPVPTSPPPTRQGRINGNLFPRLSSMAARNPQPIDPLPPSSHYLNCPRSVPGTFVPPCHENDPPPPGLGDLRPASQPRTASTLSPAPTREPRRQPSPPEQITLPARPPSRLHPLPDWAAGAREMRAMPPSPPALAARGLVPLVACSMLHPLT